MFRIIADEIEYDHRAVARLTIPEGTLRGWVEDALLFLNPPDGQSPEDLQIEIDGLRDEVKELVEDLDAAYDTCERMEKRALAAEQLLTEIKSILRA